MNIRKRNDHFVDMHEMVVGYHIADLSKMV